MKNFKNTKHFILFTIALCVFFSNCSTSLTVQKRLYRKGLNVSLSKKKKEKEKEKENHPINATLFSQTKKVVPSLEPNKSTFTKNANYNNLSQQTIEKEITLKNSAIIEVKKEETEATKNTIISNENVRKTEVKREQKSNTLLYSLFIAGALSLVGSLAFLRSKKAIHISTWAKNNKNKARLTIAISSFATTTTGFALGYLLKNEGILVSKNIFYAGTALGVLSALTYPLKSNKSNFIKRKALELIFISGILLGSASLGNAQIGSYQNSHNTEKKSENLTLIDEEDSSSHIFIKALLATGLTVAFFALGTLLLALCCNIACVGLIPVGISFLFGLGVPLVIGFVYAMRYVLRYYGKSKEEKADFRTGKRKLIPLILSTCSAVIVGITCCIWFSYIISLLSLSTLLLNCILLTGILLALILLIIAIRYW